MKHQYGQNAYDLSIEILSSHNPNTKAYKYAKTFFEAYKWDGRLNNPENQEIETKFLKQINNLKS